MSSVAASQIGTAAPDFWDGVYATTNYSRELPADIRKAVQDAVAFFGDIRGKTLIDIGYGAGATSLALAQPAANVVRSTPPRSRFRRYASATRSWA